MEKRIKGINKIDIEGEFKPGEGVDGYEYGADLNTTGVPLIDPGTGKTVSIRTFQFKMNPDPKVKRNFPDKQTLFNAHAKQITTILWGDGLRPLEEFAPRVIIDIKKGFYKIFVPCEARLNTLFVESPKNLTKELVKERKLDRLNKH